MFSQMKWSIPKSRNVPFLFKNRLTALSLPVYGNNYGDDGMQPPLLHKAKFLWKIWQLNSAEANAFPLLTFPNGNDSAKETFGSLHYRCCWGRGLLPVFGVFVADGVVLHFLHVVAAIHIYFQ